jgi:hypothetical protein
VHKNLVVALLMHFVLNLAWVEPFVTGAERKPSYRQVVSGEIGKNAEMPKCQNVKMSKCQNAKMPKCQNAKMPKCQIAKLLKCQNAKLLKCQKYQKYQEMKMDCKVVHNFMLPRY